MEHSWTVLCHRVIIDRETNRLTLVDTIESLRIQGKRADFPQAPIVIFKLDCVLASHWTRSDIERPEKSRFRLTLLDPSGAIVPFTDPHPNILEVDLTEKSSVRTQNQFLGLPIGESGRYVFLVEMEVGDRWEPVARVPYVLKIEFVDEAAAVDTEGPKKRAKKKRRAKSK
jgi:hypothetical protein